MRKLALLAQLFLALAWSATLVPELYEESYDEEFQLTPEGDNKFTLNLSLPGGNKREETVELQASGSAEKTLHTSGLQLLHFPESKLILRVTYEAGVNGYVAKYTLLPGPPPPYIPRFSVSIGGLKSAAG